MRLPLAIPLDSRTGNESKDARLTNAVVEQFEGVARVTQRPALCKLTSQSGAASGGLVAFNDTLINIFGTNIFSGTLATYYSMAFAGADESTTITNSGTGGVLTNSGHKISTLHPRTNNPSSLRVVSENEITTASAVLTHQFFEEAYNLKFDIYVASGDVIASSGDGYVDLVTVNQSASSDFYRWSLGFTTNSAGDITITVDFSDNSGNAKQWPISFKNRLNKYTTIEIIKRGSSAFVTADGVNVVQTVDETTIVPSGTVLTPILLQAYQLDFIWSANWDLKVFIDNYSLSKITANTDIGNLVAGQYDFAQSTE